MSERTISFEIPEAENSVLWHGTFRGHIFPLARPRFARGRVYQPLENQRELRAFIFDKRPERPFESFLWLDCYFYLHSRFGADLDNMVKAVCDALQFAGIVENDRQVIGGTFFRGICEDEHTTIILKEARYNAYTQIVPD
jgi:hypothetical protein